MKVNINFITGLKKATPRLDPTEQEEDIHETADESFLISKEEGFKEIYDKVHETCDTISQVKIQEAWMGEEF